MCGKFTQMASWAEVREYADLFGASVNDAVRIFTPSMAIPVLHLDAQRERVITPMAWAFTDRKTVKKARVLNNMHARGETVHKLPTFRDAFRHRRGITFAKTFNEGKELDILYDDDTPNGKQWTQQWVIKPKDNKPIIIGVIYDAFNVGNGTEYEYVQVTTPANTLIAELTDRMPLLLREDDLDLWLGKTTASLDDVRALIQTREFDPAEWDMWVEDPAKKPPRPKAPKQAKPSDQMDLF